MASITDSILNLFTKVQSVLGRRSTPLEMAEAALRSGNVENLVKAGRQMSVAIENGDTGLVEPLLLVADKLADVPKRGIAAAAQNMALVVRDFTQNPDFLARSGFIYTHTEFYLRTGTIDHSLAEFVAGDSTRESWSAPSPTIPGAGPSQNEDVRRFVRNFPSMTPGG